MEPIENSTSFMGRSSGDGVATDKWNRKNLGPGRSTRRAGLGRSVRRWLSSFDSSGSADSLPLVLRADGLVKTYHRGVWPFRREIPVLKGASLKLHAGEMVGLVGENGSGKSTIMKIVAGSLARDAGIVELQGRLGYCPQIPLVWEKLTINEHFTLFARAYNMNEVEERRAADKLLTELSFDRYASYRVEELSGGTRQKLNLALALMHEPQVLLLDEPYAGFDWETYVRFWEMVEHRRDAGLGIIIVSHFLSERDRLDRVYKMDEGKSVEE